MATTATATRSTATTTRTAPRDIIPAFMASVCKYRLLYWSHEYLAMNAVEANREVDDVIGYRWFRATDGGKLAALKLIDKHWPENRRLPERTRFILAVRESALGCLR